MASLCYIQSLQCIVYKFLPSCNGHPSNWLPRRSLLNFPDRSTTSCFTLPYRTDTTVATVHLGYYFFYYALFYILYKILPFKFLRVRFSTLHDISTNQSICHLKHWYKKSNPVTIPNLSLTDIALFQWFILRTYGTSTDLSTTGNQSDFRSNYPPFY